MKRFSALSVLGVAAVAAVVLAVPAMAGPGAQHKTMDTHPTPAFPAIGSGYNFLFWDGNGVENSLFTPTSYKDVITPSGNHNQLLKGNVANDTGTTVTYSATSGSPIPATQKCHDFDTARTSADWQMTIEANGNWTLNCHFPKA